MGCYLEFQRAVIMSYFQWIMGYFGVWWPILFGDLAFQAIPHPRRDSGNEMSNNRGILQKFGPHLPVGLTRVRPEGGLSPSVETK